MKRSKYTNNKNQKFHTVIVTCECDTCTIPMD